MALARRQFDAIVVGGGGSGLRCSLQLAEAGLRVAVFSKVFPTRSHTVAAQGGIGASLGNMSEDHWLWHMYDTIKGSDYLGDQDAIEFMCREAAKCVYELEHFGMPFDRNPDGTIYQRPFGGHSQNFGEKPVHRSCAAADRTGHAMLHTLYQRNVRANCQFFVEWMALDLIKDSEGNILGVVALEMETGEAMIFQAKATVIATGGAGRIFQSSTNAFINTGEIKEGRGVGPEKDHVLLKLDHLGAETIMKRLPGIREIAMKFANVDPIKAPIPVVPTCHYMMGGIPTNVHGQVVVPKDGVSNAVVHGLYAVGEAACVSVHGANRLGTNSLLDLVVFGRAAGNHVTQYIKNDPSQRDLPADAADLALSRLARIDSTVSGESVPEVGAAMRKTVQVHSGVFRTGQLLTEGVARIREIGERARATAIKDRSKTFNTARIEALELENLALIAEATLVSGEARLESRGAHSREDYQARDDVNFLKHSLWYAEGSRMAYKPVNLKPLTVESFEPKVRSY